MKAQLENLTKLKPDGEDFRWYLKVPRISGFTFWSTIIIDAGFKRAIISQEFVKKS